MVEKKLYQITIRSLVSSQLTAIQITTILLCYTITSTPTTVTTIKNVGSIIH